MILGRGQGCSDTLDCLEAPGPDAILSANIGCITHLQSGTETPVMHWIEWLDARLNPRRPES